MRPEEEVLKIKKDVKSESSKIKDISKHSLKIALQLFLATPSKR